MSSDEQEKPKKESALKSFLSGGFGGGCLVLVGHPLDLVKVRIQTGGAAMADAGALNILRTTFVNEGVRGLYRGVSAPIIAVAPIFAICFWAYDMGKRAVRYLDGQDPNLATELSIGQVAFAGALSAIPPTAIMAPSERIKCLLQVQAGDVEKGLKPKYSGFVDCARKIYGEGGMRSLFKGTGATLMRDIPGSAVYFGTYEWTKREICYIQGVDSSHLSPIAVLTAGGLAGMANWAIAIPPDVLKSRYQTAPPGKYSGLMDVYKEVMAEEGVGGLFRGIRPAMLRAFPANAACFFGMELSRSLLSFMD